jgi:hypothetical protein
MYPPDPVRSLQESSPSTSKHRPDAVTPSLVTRLQKMHGLTKKKIYGSQLTHEPFIQDEPAHGEYLQVAPPPSVPSQLRLSLSHLAT